MNDIEYMRLALSLAKKGMGWTSPNPMVGAVIVKDGRIIGCGYHRRYGGLHAEREALASCTESPAGAEMYVTLEPCCHRGRQPPCTGAILAAGIARVIAGSQDPNPLVAGKGFEQLRAVGIAVEDGVLRKECDALNRVFFHYITTGRPYVTMKYAMTLDGKIAARTGASRWITGKAARNRVHWDRHRNAAILVGSGTVLGDDPLLTCRLAGGKQPLRVVCDTQLRTPPDCQLVRTAGKFPTILATAEYSAARREPYEKAGCRVWTLPVRDGHVDLAALMDRLGAEQIDSVLLEGGGSLNWAALEAGLVHKVQAYIAPKIFGGEDAKSPVRGLGVDLPAQCAQLEHLTVTRFGDDLLLEGEVKRHVYGDH